MKKLLLLVLVIASLISCETKQKDLRFFSKDEKQFETMGYVTTPLKYGETEEDRELFTGNILFDNGRRDQFRIEERVPVIDGVIAPGVYKLTFAFNGYVDSLHIKSVGRRDTEFVHISTMENSHSQYRSNRGKERTVITFNKKNGLIEKELSSDYHGYRSIKTYDTSTGRSLITFKGEPTNKNVSYSENWYYLSGHNKKYVYYEYRKGVHVKTSTTIYPDKEWAHGTTTVETHI